MSNENSWSLTAEESAFSTLPFVVGVAVAFAVMMLFIAAAAAVFSVGMFAVITAAVSSVTAAKYGFQ